jgi:endo-1,4-beta-D-glucanase Y
MKRLFLAGLLAASTISMAAVKFPYPQTQAYPHAKNLADYVNCAGQTPSTQLLDQFEKYLKSYYEENGSQARIKFDEDQYTVSEGIGYGMILCVYFSNANKSYQSQFDKLWAYYKAHSNNGVMDWKIQGFGGAVGTGGATDAEEDVAFALVMASYQFEDSKYLSDAKTLIAKMRQSEFASDGRHKVGNQWDPYLNPSYVSPAAYEIFKDVDDASFWSKAISTNYDIVLGNRNSSTGIPSGWANMGSPYGPITGNNGYNFAGYDYDAVRAPWRWAWSYAWYGHSQAKDLSEKLAKWVSTKTFGQLYINMKTDGSANMQGEPCKSNGCKANGSSIGSLSSVLIVDEKYSDLIKTNYSALMSQQPGYFHSNLRLLTGLLMSGNMQNFATMKNPVAAKEIVIPDSCNAEVILHQNSGAFGWNSTSVVLENETNTSVHMGSVIQGDHRELVRHLTGLKSGSKYTLSFKANQTPGAALWLTYAVYSDSLGTNQYCGAMKKTSNTEDLVVTCEIDATGEDMFVYWTLNNWDDPQVDIFDLSLIGSDGKDLVEEQVVGIPDFTLPASKLNVAVEGKNLLIQLPKADLARVTVMDMQGRVVSSFSMNSRAGQIPMDLSQGNYMLRVKQGASSWVRAIRIAE